MTGEALLEVQARYPQHSLVLRLDPAARPGPPVGELDSVPVYASVKAVHTWQGEEGSRGEGVEALEINYLTFYPYNGPYRVARVAQTGAHDGDWEHLTVRWESGGSMAWVDRIIRGGGMRCWGGLSS